MHPLEFIVHNFHVQFSLFFYIFSSTIFDLVLLHLLSIPLHQLLF
jgi:hypothetical protein